MKITQVGKKMGRDFNTEHKILLAAENVFHEKGFEGARMQEIADHAKINKGLLHYYFKTKNKLFETIFSKAISKMMVKVEDIMKGEGPFLEKIDAFIDNYMEILRQNPFVPKFVISELNRDPDRFIRSLIARHDLKTRLLYYYKSLETAVSNGEIKPTEPKQLLINIISLCVFPFIGRPMIQGILDIDHAGFKKFLNERNEQVKLFVRQSIKLE
jgi:TetR/AcrR family transcriptional regulator